VAREPRPPGCSHSSTRLHEVPFEGEWLLHLDLHSDNVLLSRRGPVVIDWTNARAGDPALDVALTWVIGATSGGLVGRRDRRSRTPSPSDSPTRTSQTERTRVRRLLR
jgi:aminoglycoside phosphotransferase (APT) family kinase protein